MEEARTSVGAVAAAAERDEEAREWGGAAAAAAAAALRAEAVRPRGGALLLEVPAEEGSLSADEVRAAVLQQHAALPDRASLPRRTVLVLRAALGEYRLLENGELGLEARSHPESRPDGGRKAREARSEPRSSDDQCSSRIRRCMCAAVSTEELLTNCGGSSGDVGGGGCGGAGGGGGLSCCP